MKNKLTFKNKPLLILLFFFSFLMLNAQDYCSQYEFEYINDNNASFTINLSDITCNSGYPIDNINFSFYSYGRNVVTGSRSYCGQAFSISTNLDGDIETGDCSPYLYSYSFNTLTVTVNDLDGELDDVDLDVYIDVSYFPPCDVPSNLTATNITETGATLSLIEEGDAGTWNWYVTPNSWDTPDYYNQTLYTFSETVNWNEGTEGTTYYAYGRSECSFDYEYGRSDYVGPIIFTTVTPCSEPSNLTATNTTTTGTTLGLTGNGEATNYDWYIVPINNPAPIAGSTPTINDTTTSNIWSGGTVDTSYHAYGRSDCNGDDIAVSAWFGPITFTTECTEDYAISADNASVNNGNSTNITVANSTIGVNYSLRDDATDTVIGSPVAGTGTSISLNTGALTSATTFNVLVEDIGICSMQLSQTTTVTVIFCIDPSTPTATNITLTGADLGLTENSTATNWDWYIVPNGATVPTTASTPTINDTTNPTTWTGGSQGVTYDAYVRSDCNADNTFVSNWVGPKTFNVLEDCNIDLVEVVGTPFDGVQYGTVNYADIDGDNDQDVLITGLNASNVEIAKLYLNDGTGGFTLVAGTPFEGVRYGAVTFADIDGDNDQDVFITGRNTASQKTAKLYTNNAGVFTLVTGTTFPGVDLGAVAFVDVDNDNDKDLLLTGQKSGAPTRIAKLFLNDGTGGFTEDVTVPFDGVRLGSIAIADVDNNGYKDIFITGENSSSTRIAKLYTNNAGNFTFKTGNTFDGVRRSSIAFTDVNNDNKQDIIITGENSSGTRIAKLYTNDGTGVFTEVATSLEGVYLGSISVADIDLDGDEEVIITGINDNTSSIAKMYCNNGTGIFTEITSPFNNIRNSAISFGDINNDSFLDVIITGKESSGQRKSRLYSNFVPCTKPASQSASNFTFNGADLDWLELGSATIWDIQIGIQGFVHTNTPTHNNVSKPFTYSDGLENTNYEYYVRSNCSVGVENSDWIGPFSFTTTQCSTDVPSNLSANNISALGADLNWTENGTTTNWDIELGSQGFTTTGTPTNENVTKPFNFADGAELTGYDFYVRTDCNEDNNVVSTWAGPFTFTTTNCVIADPSNLVATNLTTNGANLNWTENGTVNHWDIEIGQQGFTATGIPNFNDVAKPFTYTNGTSNTAYDFYVRSNCNNNSTNVSNWVGPFSFNTLTEETCATISINEITAPFEDVRYGSVAFADIDNDNDQDVLITGDRPGNLRTASLYTNDGSGNYTLVSGTPFEGVRSSAIAFADVDGDNDQDVIITGQGYHPTSIDPNIAKMYLNDGSGNFTLVTGTPFIGVFHSAIAFGDIDNDNDMDVVITGDQEGGINKITKLYRNNGAGIFTLETGTPFDGIAHSSVAFADMDNDNDLDLIITGNRDAPNLRLSKLFLNNGTGVFTEDTSVPFEGVNLGSVAIADIDNDNDPDVLIVGRNNSNGRIAKLYTNNGTGTFTEVSGTPFEGVFYSSIAFMDLENDGDQDVLITGQDSSDKKVSILYTNNGSGIFSEVNTTLVEPFEGIYRGSVAVADIDNDNNPDILITGLNQTEQKSSKIYKTSLLVSPILSTKYDGTSWTDGLPTINKCAEIDSDYTTTSFTSYRTTVNTGKILTIAANTYMEVDKDIVNNGTIIVEPTGSVVQIDDAAQSLGSGTFTTNINTTSLEDSNRFTYFSSPSRTEILDVFRPWAKLNRMFLFDDSIQQWDSETFDHSMVAGAGIAIQANSSNLFPTIAQTSFSGAFNNGLITKNLSFDVYNNVVANFPNPLATNDDSNFVGNPYPSAISADDLITSNDIDEITIWTHESVLLATGVFENDDYISCVIGTCTDAPSGGVNGAHNGTIASGQGFFVIASAASSLTFNNSMRRKTGNDQFRNSESNPKVWLDMVSTFGFKKQIALTFTENGSLEFDTKYESKTFGSNYGLGFYSFNNQNDKLTINDSGNFDETLSIPLGYYINSSEINDALISINNIQNMEDINIYLKDHLLNVITDLKRGDYLMQIDEVGENNNRFEVIFNRNALGTNELTLHNNLIVSNQDQNILVSTNNGNRLSNVKMFDVLGKLISNTKANSESVLLLTNINQGTILFIKATLDNGVVLNKKFIKF